MHSIHTNRDCIHLCRSYTPMETACACQSLMPLRSCNNHVPWPAGQPRPSEAEAAAAEAAAAAAEAPETQAAAVAAAQDTQSQAALQKKLSGFANSSDMSCTQPQLCQLAGLPLVCLSPCKDSIFCLLSCYLSTGIVCVHLRGFSERKHHLSTR